MRAVHVIHSVADQSAGPSHSVRRLCESLIQSRARVTLATLQAHGASGLSFERAFAPSFGPKKLGHSFALRNWLHAEVGLAENCIVHTHIMWMLAGVYPGELSRRRKCHFVHSPRGGLSNYSMSIGSRFKPAFWRLLQKPALQHVSMFHATSAAEGEDIRRLGFSQPIAIIPNGVDVPATSKWQKASPRRVIYLGRVHPEKGLKVLVQAWAASGSLRDDWLLSIVGPDSGGHQAELQAMIGRLGVRNIEFVPPVYSDAKNRLLASADFLVLPSPSENFGMVVAEALAAGIPVLCTKGAPWREIEERGAGWWVESDPVSMAAALQMILNVDREVLIAMGMIGRDWMERSYSWRSVASSMLEAYDWLIHGGDPPSFVVT